MDLFCPNCGKHSISHGGICQICERDFKTGHLVIRGARRIAGLVLPSIREAAPGRLARCFREPKPKNCGLTLKR